MPPTTRIKRALATVGAARCWVCERLYNGVLREMGQIDKEVQRAMRPAA
jgi:hypothetical protein